MVPYTRDLVQQLNGQSGLRTINRVEVEFDRLHVCSLQTAPDFIRQSPLAEDAGVLRT